MPQNINANGGPNAVGPVEAHPFTPASNIGKWYLNNGLHIPVPQPFAGWHVQNNPSGTNFGFVPHIDTRCLFLGTFPAYDVVRKIRANGNMEFFYGSTSNNFWPILQRLSGVMLNSEVAIFGFLTGCKFGVTDILYEVRRQGKSSEDDNLLPAKYNHLMELLDSFGKIKTIYTTSGGSSAVYPSSKNSAAKWLLTYLQSLGLTVRGFNVTGYMKRITVFSGYAHVWEFDLINLLSPSPNANRSIQRKIRSNPNILPLLALLPIPMRGLSPIEQVRLTQWAYLLYLGGCFPLESSMKKFVKTNQTALQTIYP